jgi:hypothetical protein
MSTMGLESLQLVVVHVDPNAPFSVSRMLGRVGTSALSLCPELLRDHSRPQLFCSPSSRPRRAIKSQLFAPAFVLAALSTGPRTIPRTPL